VPAGVVSLSPSKGNVSDFPASAPAFVAPAAIPAWGEASPGQGSGVSAVANGGSAKAVASVGSSATDGSVTPLGVGHLDMPAESAAPKMERPVATEVVEEPEEAAATQTSEEQAEPSDEAPDDGMVRVSVSGSGDAARTIVEHRLQDGRFMTLDIGRPETDRIHVAVTARDDSLVRDLQSNAIALTRLANMPDPLATIGALQAAAVDARPSSVSVSVATTKVPSKRGVFPAEGDTPRGERRHGHVAMALTLLDLQV